jgi:hypothetical protein
MDYAIYAVTLSAWQIVIVAPLSIMIAGAARVLFRRPSPDEPL